jgi:predicted dehydrogenase
MCWIWKLPLSRFISNCRLHLKVSNFGVLFLPVFRTYPFNAITTAYAEVAEIVAFCDLSQTRMDGYNRQLVVIPGLNSVPTYKAEQFDQMIAETKPDIVIVTTIDCTHPIYITRAMELGCDVISEKPMTTDLPKLQAIFNTIEKTGRSLRVTFNYRYAPAYTRFRQLVIDRAVGRP